MNRLRLILNGVFSVLVLVCLFRGFYDIAAKFCIEVLQSGDYLLLALGGMFVIHLLSEKKK